MTNYILQYYQQIQDGTVNAPVWIKLSYKMIIDGLQQKLFFYDAKKARKAIGFIEGFCRHHEGALAPQLIKLELWQKAFISCVFGIMDSNDRRQFREVILIIGRKNGKTLLAAAIAAYMTFLDGEYGARIYFTAPKLEQASFCYDAFYQMIQKEPELKKLSNKRRSDVYIESTNSSAKPIAFSAKKSEGLNVSLAIADEIASWQGDPGIKFYNSIRSSFGSREQPLLLSISTAGYVDGGIYDDLIARCTRVLKGDSRESRLLPMLYIMDDPLKWNDISELQQSNPNLGVSISVDYLLEEIAIAEGSLAKKVEFLVKYCNIKQNAASAWLDAFKVEKASGSHLSLEDFRNSYCVVGVDLSQTTDLTTAVALIQKGDQLYFIGKAWLPSERLQKAIDRDQVPYHIYQQQGFLGLSGDNFIDYHDVYQWITDLVTEYQIYPLKIGYDRYSSQYLIQDLKSYGMHCDDVYQGENLYPVLMEFEGLLNDGVIHIGDNQLMKMHLLDSAIKMSTERNRGKLVKLRQLVHIDYTAAMIDAMTVRQKYWNEIGGQLINI